MKKPKLQNKIQKITINIVGYLMGVDKEKENQTRVFRGVKLIGKGKKKLIQGSIKRLIKIKEILFLT